MSKERITAVAAQLRDAANTMDPIARAAIELVKLSAEAVKESLVTAEGDDMLRQQGAARHLSKMLTELTTQPPQIPR